METTTINTKLKYEGYIWFSDKDTPDVYDNETINIDINTLINPFIIEAHLYCKAQKQSTSIRYIDGTHIIKNYLLDELSQLEKTSLTYIPNRMPGIKELCFNQYWRTSPDPLCENMDTLQPAELVFTGFIKNN
ncbi:MAG: TIGR04423 family type III CRISPR-associated protein [Tannerellaceae bacterium]